MSNSDITFDKRPDLARFFEDNFLQCVFEPDPDGDFVCDTGDHGFYFIGFHRYRMDFPKFYSPSEAMDYILSHPIRVFLAMDVIINHLKFNYDDSTLTDDSSEDSLPSQE